MYRIRRGKDFKVIWSFFDCDGKPYLLEREFLTMYAVNSFCTFEVTDFTVDGNTVIWLFRGKDQKNLGDYTLELVKNNGEDGMIPIETVDAFTLVQYTRDEARCDCENIKVEDVTINSSLDIDTIASLSIDTALSATSNNAIANFVVTRELNKKQDTIDDLATIRSGAVKGATAVQNVVSSNSNYVTVSREGFEWIISPKTKKVSEAGDPVDHLSGIADAHDVKQELAKKVDNVSGKQLSTEDFTTALKQKLQSLNNYDDSALTSAINSLQNQINTLVSGNASSAIDTFNEIIAFLNGVKDTQDLAGIIASIEQQIASVNNSLSAELAKKPNKTELATINGQSLTNGGNIVIEGKNYDAELAEQEQKLTELSSEVSEVSEAVGKKADEQGYYPNLSVGMADNLLGHAPAVEREIVFDATASKDNDVTEDVARIESIKGNSVVWNQNIKKGVSTYGNKGFSQNNGNVDILRYDEQADEYTYPFSQACKRIYTKFSTIASHKYLVHIGIKLETQNTYNGSYYLCYFGNPTTQWITNKVDISNYTNKEYVVSQILSATGNSNEFYIGIYDAPLVAEDITHISKPRIYDLTQMFGAGNEPTTIDEFYSRIPSGVDINAYNEGEVIHNYAAGLKSVGFNAWDEQWELGTFNTTTGANITRTEQIRTKNLIRVLPNTDYYIKTPTNVWMLMYDNEGKVIEGYKGGNIQDGNSIGVYASVGKFKTAPNASYLKFYLLNTYGSTYKNDICIHLAHTGYRNGEYAPYWEESIGLPNTLVFADGMKSAGSARDELYYDRYAKKWRVIKRVGVVDMGTLNWKTGSSYENAFFVFPFTGAKPAQFPLCARYEAKNLAEKKDKSVYVAKNGESPQLYIIDSAYSDVASLKTSLQGAMLYYELAEPIESDLDDYLPATMSAEERAKVHQFIYRVSDFGTEQMLTEEGVKSSALVADIVYGVDAFRTLVNLRKRVAALEK